MRRTFTLLIIFSWLFLPSCSKDVFKRYEKRIIGIWHITDVKRIGIGGDTKDLAFQNGSFQFNENGSLTYTDLAGNIFSGSWDIVKKTNTDQVTQSLHITAVDFNTQLVQTEYYDDLAFPGTDHFKATINSTTYRYVTHFRR